MLDLNSPFHSFIEKIVVLSTTFFLLLVHQTIPVSLALLFITLFALFPFPFSFALSFSLSFPFSIAFNLSLSFPLNNHRPLPLFLHTFALEPFPIVHNFHLFPITYNRWMLH